MTSAEISSKSSSNAAAIVEVNTSEPATNATPSTTASPDRSKRNRCATTLRSEAFHMGQAPGPDSAGLRCSQASQSASVQFTMSRGSGTPGDAAALSGP